MTIPENPETIIVKNRFYPQGLREIDIWGYYQKVKPQILKETRNRDLMFFISTDVNKPIIKRKIYGKYIRLTPQNYDQMITGRTLSIHSTMSGYETFGILDIDIDPRDGFKWAQIATRDVYDFVMDKMPIIKSAQIRFTGKDSFHIKCNFNRKMKIDVIRFLLRKFLVESELSKVYTIEGKRRPGVPNIDLNRNCLRCNFITLQSLSILGLRSMEVPYQSLMKFNQRQALI